MFLKKYAIALMLFTPLHASNLLTTDKIATSVGVNKTEYNAMNVIKQFRAVYATEKSNKESIIRLNEQWSHYIGFGKLHQPNGTYIPDTPDNLVRKEAATLPELQDIFPVFLSAAAKSKMLNLSSDQRLSHHLMTYYQNFTVANPADTHIKGHLRGALYLAHFAETMAMNSTITDLRSLIEKTQEAAGNTFTMTTADRLTAYARMGFDPLAISKNLTVETRKKAEEARAEEAKRAEEARRAEEAIKNAEFTASLRNKDQDEWDRLKESDCRHEKWGQFMNLIKILNSDNALTPDMEDLFARELVAFWKAHLYWIKTNSSGQDIQTQADTLQDLFRLYNIFTLYNQKNDTTKTEMFSLFKDGSTIEIKEDEDTDSIFFTFDDFNYMVAIALRIMDIPDEPPYTMNNITKHYWKRSKKYHPDKTSDKPDKEKEIANHILLKTKETYEFIARYVEWINEGGLSPSITPSHLLKYD